MFALNTKCYFRINRALLIRLAKNGSVEQASCVPGDVEVKSDPLYTVRFVIIYIDLMRNQPLFDPPRGDFSTMLH